MSEPALPTFGVTDAQYRALLPTLRHVARAEETRRLARALALSRGFSFHLATCETPLIAKALILCLAREVPTLSGEPTRMATLAPVRGAEVALSARELTHAIFEGLLGSAPSPEPQITFLDATDSRSDDLDAWLWLFQRLNERRNHLYASGHALVFLLPPALTAELIRFAPDLWSIRSASIRLAAPAILAVPQETLHDLGEERGAATRDLAAQHEKVKRMLASSGPHGLSSLMVEFRRLAEALHERGETLQAVSMLREQILPRLEQLHPIELKARLFRDVVETWVRLGRAAEAEQAARLHVLPHLAARGRVMTQAMVLARIADAYRLSGAHDRALRLLLEEALPLANKLEDGEAAAEILTRAVISQVRSSQLSQAQALLEQHRPFLEQWAPPLEYAFMNLQLAEALRASGEPDASLETLQRYVLPNVRHDARLQALAWHAVARAQRGRGDLREALRVMRAEVVPRYRKLENLEGRVTSHLAMAQMLQDLGAREEGLRLLREEKAALRRSRPSSPREETEYAALLAQVATGLHLIGEHEEARELLRSELQASDLGESARVKLQERQALIEADAGEQGSQPERRHTCVGPEVYDDPA